MLVGTVRESFMWKVGFELDLLKGGSKIQEVGAAALGPGSTVMMLGKSEVWQGRLLAGETTVGHRQEPEEGGCVLSRLFRISSEWLGPDHFSWPLSACFGLSPSHFSVERMEHFLPWEPASLLSVIPLFSSP